MATTSAGTEQRGCAPPTQLTRAELAALLAYRDSSALTKGLRRLGLAALTREDRALAREDRPRSTARIRLEA
jgi:hypothetical protein